MENKNYNFRFAHLADCHIGAWVDPRMKKLALDSFEKAVSIIISQGVDFVLISGDLFNTAIPGIDLITETAKILRKLKDANISIYVIPGSHDFSPSGKTILKLFVETGLIIIPTKNDITSQGKLMLKYVIDEKTQVKITGILGRKNMLEKEYYELLERTNLETEEGFKIFMLHSSITELKDNEFEKMESLPLSLLPRNQNYYAAGHVHLVVEKDFEGYGKVVFPGPLFPANFKELEKLESGSFFINDVAMGIIHSKIVKVLVKNIFSVRIEANGLTPRDVEERILSEIDNKEFNETIVTISVFGELKSGKTQDIDFKKIFDMLYSKSAYFVMKNSTKLQNKEQIQNKIDPAKDIFELEDELIENNLSETLEVSKENEKSIVKNAFSSLSLEKNEGEKQIDYETRVFSEILKVVEELF
ncbi:MAG TPA: DNA repair exonuclease [Candidatus Woesearchaeota archaeon]|nr:DNA repair exonuclease [Candidatus Woesearchaeota archaeon]